MGLKSQYGGWMVVFLVIALAIVVTGAVLTLCRRRLDWQWGRRNVWSICEEWRRRLSWLWAPREEKVGLVKAQHPTAQQTIPGLYRQPDGNTSQNFLHSDSDLRLDAQGAFTRFEAVDRDLHPPLCSSNAIPPQPLRPAPQPRRTGRPRPSPLCAPSHTTEYLKMGGPGPLTPPPVPRLPNPVNRKANTAGDERASVFLFQRAMSPADGSSMPIEPSAYQERARTTETARTRLISGDSEETSRFTTAPQQSGRVVANHRETGDDLATVYDDGVYGILSNGQLLSSLDAADIIDRELSSPTIVSSSSVDSGVVVNEINKFRQCGRNKGSVDERDEYRQQQQQQQQQDTFGFDLHNCGNNSSAHRTAMESIYGPHQAMVAKFHLENLQNWPNALHQRDSQNHSQSIEMIPYLTKSSTFHRDDNLEPAYSTKAQEHRVSKYIESLPDLPAIYDSDPSDRAFDHRHEDMQSPVPPPAPPDLSRNFFEQNNTAPTTGERIFSALRSVTSQSYIDASEFYNSLLSSAQQQAPRFGFPTITRSSMSLIEPDKTHRRDNGLSIAPAVYSADPESTVGADGKRRASDLYSPELNLEAHRTAQEVYNSLQDPPASPLLLRDHGQETYPYMSDPSFTRTSEDIFNSIEQRRKSMERLHDGLHETFIEMEVPDGTRRNSQDLYAALEEVQLRRRLSQNSDEQLQSYGGGSWFEQLNGSAGGDSTSPLNRRGSQEPEPPPDESNLKRAVSCESVCSDTSVNLGDLENVTVVGHVCVGLEHERWGGRGADCEGDLAVSVLEARDLVAPDGHPAQDTLARVCLLPDRQIHVQTRLYRGSPSPSYQEKFLFSLDGGPIGRTLLVQIFSMEMGADGGASLLGEASLKLGPAARPPATTWLPLVSPVINFPHHGELMFSLSYLPTAERLTLVVVKARNLCGANPSVPGDFFVKVYLLQQGKKMHKKKTSTKRGEKSPIFNEAIIFSVPPHALQTIQLRLTVAENDPATNSKGFSVGHIIVGSTAAGKSLSHWRHMLAAMRRPVAMWHPLRK